MQRVTDIPSMPPRPAAGHKGTFGTALVVAGSRGMAGAAALAGSAALAGGAGLSRVAGPAEVMPAVNALDPGVLTTALPHDAAGRLSLAAERELLRLAGDADAVAAGPGLSTAASVRWLVGRLWRAGRPLVLDADALNVIAPFGGLPPRGAPTVMTPHPGEFARLAGIRAAEVQADRERHAGRLAAAAGCVVLLKGAGTVVTDGSRSYHNTTGNPGMATAGCGDVLTGLLAALLAQGVPAFEAAALAAHLHGLAGDLAAAACGRAGLTARELLRHLPAAARQHETP